uniref:Retrotransposon protein, putative, unclassified n=2 Tax=Oryza sativa subsp. japonica TaxID=39947 RepID=Q53J97_ORYSJ|nr:Integrase core domain, putative [Oryza sativa Japonica Group]AAX95813.1 retrotransposon protein, putative, unclassified [Oryza sativa Japonica Group]ABA93060.1 retrotransposon protein, putative, unclassified [Oryza sativa Japonica Group]
MTPVDSMSKDPPAEAENGISTTSEPEKDPNAAKSCPSDKKHEPTRTTSEVTRTWCPIHKTRRHILQTCSVFLDVQAEIRASKERGIQRTSPPRDVYCPIHKAKTHDLSSCKVHLSAMRTSPPKVQQSQIYPRDADKEQGATTISDRFVRVIDIDPHEPSILHLLEDQASSSTSTPCDVYAIDGTSTSRDGDAETADQSVTPTPAQHIRILNAILSESPFDPVLNADLDQWTERLRESVANLSNAFAEAAARAPLEQPPTGGANGEQPEERTPHRQATPPPRGNSDLRDHLNGRREARRTQDNENRTIEKYDGSTDPEEFLQVYSRVLYVAGADDNALANYLPTAMKESAQSWLVHLPPYSISSWADLWQQFVTNFQGTYKRHAIEDDLHTLTNMIPEITDASVIRALKSGVRDHYTTQELATRRITTAHKLFEIVDRCAHTDDALRHKNDKPRTGGEKKPAKDARLSQARKRVAGVGNGRLKRSPRPECYTIHKSDKHPLETCFVFKKALTKQLALEKGKRGAASKMKWSEQKIEFSEADHLKTAVTPGRYPIVVEPTIQNIKVARVLIDDGSSINLLFASTLDAMGIPRKQITFDVAEFDAAYNAIIGRTALTKFIAASHYAYQVLKMPGPKGTITIQGNEKLAVQCDKRSLDMVEHTPNTPATAEPPKKPFDMPGVPREVIKHKLIVRPNAKPVKQKLRRFAPDRKQAIREAIRKWRMCIDFTGLNKACPKDHFPLPRIDQLVDSTAGFQGALNDQLGHNVEAYVDDIVVKKKTSDSLIDDLRETFDNLRRYRLMLNPKKCTFGVPSGKLLGSLVSERGIEVNPEKIVGHREREIAHKTQGSPEANWMHGGTKQEAEDAFIALKHYLSNPHVLVAPQPNEELFLYIAATPYSPTVTAVSSFPLGEVVRNKDVVGRIAKWVLELSQFNVHFVPQIAIKSQVLADFVADWTMPENKSDSQTDSETWTMAFDGALNSQGPGAGSILTSPSGDQFKHEIHLNFRATNNTAEYEGLLAGIRAAAALGVKRLIVKGDSELVANQVHKDYKCSSPELSKYLAEVRKLEKRFDGIEVRDIYCKDNIEPDDLAWRASRREPLEPSTFLDVLTKPSVKEANNEEAEKITRQAKIYCMIGNDLYKKASNGVLLKCLWSDDGKHLLLDIHEGICESHAGGRKLRCEACQFHSKHTKLPAQVLQTIPLTWPFSCWGLDILGPFPRGQGGYKFLFVAIDKFTKWTEVTPTGEIKANNAINFIKGIFCKYGLPHRIITDNCSQFISADFQDYCIKLGVKICFASVSHPQSNGQVERENGIVLQGIETRVYDRLMSYDKKWIEELPSILWAVCTTPTTSNKETSFFLVYGSEAMLPTELRH